MRSLRSREVEIVPGNPFENCKLDRKKYAEILTQIIENYSDGFVLSVNNKWGEGKTTFIKMWKVYLGNKGFRNVYFNAWEHDFGQDPMAAILSEIKSLNFGNKGQLEGIIKKAGKLSIQLVPILLKAVADKYMDTKSFADGIKELGDKAIVAFQTEVDEYAKKKEGLEEFKNALAEYVSTLEKPLVFIIDELDRCNPKYAVEVLEIIKHFFSVSGIVFVLSIDKEQLGNAIRGYYGSDLIEADEYLRRFIDVEYSIPTPQTKKFNEYLYESYKFNEFFFSVERIKYPELKSDAEILLKIADILFTKTKATLRQQERIFALTRLILFSFNSNQYTFSNLLFILVYLKTLRNDYFIRISSFELSIQELSDLFYDIIYSENSSLGSINLLYVEALLLWFYNNDKKYEYKINLIQKDDSDKIITPIKSKLEIKFSKSNLAQLFGHISTQWNFERIGLSYLINKINLTEPLSIQ
ncbi:KAP family P-loop NTPase fold protein [Algoriphagus mannitolivorans]|uniref:KAP family P-loop NTPase fold protein n=1 Tax=Algoriphagus mannitolivorans TaxID=226504 RepID=UPI0003FD79E4|nr:P-loop NTPase fold protein [Algoriphagus mannitolivorans]